MGTYHNHYTQGKKNVLFCFPFGQKQSLFITKVKLFITYLTLVEIFRPLTFWDDPHSVECVSPRAALAFWDRSHSVYGMCISLNKSTSYLSRKKKFLNSSRLGKIHKKFYKAIYPKTSFTYILPFLLYVLVFVSYFFSVHIHYLVFYSI